MKYGCSQPDCTIAVTGRCLLSHVPVESCPYVQVQEEQVVEKEAFSHGSLGPTSIVYPGNELGLKQVGELFATQYGYLIGVLGAHATGKTCLLCSLYLLASCGDLRPTRLFAGSMTLPGFEGRLRLLRKWSGAGLPDKIVDHTRLLDPRQPGFLHLGFRETAGSHELRNLLFTDLPGEWTTDLINRASVASRFDFLKRADAIVIAVPAPQLLALETRNSQIQSARMLLQRLRDAVGIAADLPIIFAITRCDQVGPVTPPAMYQIVSFAREIGFANTSHIPVASFSERPDVPSGMGLSELLDAILPIQPSTQDQFSPDLDGQRMFVRFRFRSETEL